MKYIPYPLLQRDNLYNQLFTRHVQPLNRCLKVYITVQRMDVNFLHWRPGSGFTLLGQWEGGRGMTQRYIHLLPIFF